MIIENLKANFGNLSLNALSRSTDEFLKLAKAKLESEREVSIKELDKKKSLIDLQLGRMTTELDNVSRLMKELEKDRVEKFGQLSSHVKWIKAFPPRKNLGRSRGAIFPGYFILGCSTILGKSHPRITRPVSLSPYSKNPFIIEFKRLCALHLPEQIIVFLNP